MTAILLPFPLPDRASTQAQADVSRATVALFIERRSLDLPIRDLAANAGISERTFYRYFPRKEDVVRPFFEGGLRRIIANFASRPPREPIIASLQAAWSDAWPLAAPEASARLYHMLEANESFRAVRLQVVVDSEVLWACALAVRLAIDPQSQQAVFAGAAVVTAFRLAWQAISLDPQLDPMAVLMANFHMFNMDIFADGQPDIRPQSI